MEEEWKDIQGYEGRYQVSNLGKVKSLRFRNTNKQQVLKASIINRRGKIEGYYAVNLKNKLTYIHRLVAETFIPNPKNKLEVNHINCNKLDNRVTNLEWVTRKENMQMLVRMA